MFKIKTAHAEEVLEKLTYIKLQSNGVIITCESKEEAHGVLNKDFSLIYAFANSPIADKYEIAEVYPIALDEYLDTYLAEKKIIALPEKVSMLETYQEVLIQGATEITGGESK